MFIESITAMGNSIDSDESRPEHSNLVDVDDCVVRVVPRFTDYLGNTYISHEPSPDSKVLVLGSY